MYYSPLWTQPTPDLTWLENRTDLVCLAPSPPAVGPLARVTIHYRHPSHPNLNRHSCEKHKKPRYVNLKNKCLFKIRISSLRFSH